MESNKAAGFAGLKQASGTNAFRSSATRPTILIADASATIRLLLRHHLQQQNYDVLEAVDGSQAIDLVTRSTEVNGILMDLHLGEPSGYEVCRNFKNDVRLQHIPVILMTNPSCDEEIDLAISVGADEVLGKPFAAAELKLRIGSVFQHQVEDGEVLDAENSALTLARAVAVKNGYGIGHVDLVANYAVAFGKFLGLGFPSLQCLRYGSILHNVGKLGIPDLTIKKSGPGTAQGRSHLDESSVDGCDARTRINTLSAIYPNIRHHKERAGGSGCADGLAGNAIPLEAKIIEIADIYSGLTEDRAFRPAKSHEHAVEILLERARNGIHDPKLTNRFCDWMSDQTSLRRDGSGNAVEIWHPLCAVDPLPEINPAATR